MRLTPLLTRLPLFLLLLAGPAAGLLSGCSAENVNARQQSGVWTITRVTYTTYDSVGTVLTTATTADAGEIAFVNTSHTTNKEARFYIDREIISPQLAALLDQGSPTVSGLVVAEWVVDADARRRVSLRAITANPALAQRAFVYTITDDTDDTQRWEVARGDAKDRVRFREVWEVARVQ